jgi:hypothetical protein
MATCLECRGSYTRKRIDQSFCSTACSKKADARELKRARAVYRALYHWRYDRKWSGIGDALRFICREIADWIAEDRQHQRLPPPRPNMMIPRGHERKKGRTVDPAFSKIERSYLERHERNAP